MPDGAFDVVIYHNPACGTSRNTLAMIRNAGIEPHVIEYLKTPPARALLKQLLDRAGLAVRAALRPRRGAARTGSPRRTYARTPSLRQPRTRPC